MNHVPVNAKSRKLIPICTGVLDYFPDALLAVAEVSRIGSEQHSPGEPIHWAKEKSTDEADALLRHLVDRGKIDADGVRHSAKVAWRALALLQREIDAEKTLTEVQAPPMPTAEEAMEGLPEEAKDALRALKKHHDSISRDRGRTFPCNSDRERSYKNVGNPCFAGPDCCCGGKHVGLVKDGGKTEW